MVFSLDNVVPWGRSLDEYTDMFALTRSDRETTILGCADGPASFNAELTAAGGRVVSVDPLYAADVEEIRRHIALTAPVVLEQLRRNRDDFVWTRVADPDALGALRQRAMDRFLDDFPSGKTAGRYRAERLPALAFRDGAFDLALCSHFLFMYADTIDTDFHCACVGEMLRVAREARLFPLTTLGGAPSPHLEPVCRWVRERGWTARRVRVPYEFQRGANEMLVVTRA
jgi:hypothetical protein